MDKVKMVWSKTNRWHRGFLIFLIIEMKVLPAGQRGFICNDPALSHTFDGDTINMKHLFGTVLLLPLAVMLLAERRYHKEDSTKPKKVSVQWYIEYLYGTLLNLIAVQGIKMVVGAPRPHFFDTCQPSEGTTCQSGEFVPNYTCTKQQLMVSESNKSFPSGHTALAVHAGLFIAYYLYRRAANTTTVNLSQAALLSATVYCGVSRMWDHRHHWWDVVAGAVVALPILLYTIFYLCNNFEARKTDEQSEADKSTDDFDLTNLPVLETKKPLDTQ